MHTPRRTFLTGSVAIASGVALAGCAATPTTQSIQNAGLAAAIEATEAARYSSKIKRSFDLVTERTNLKLAGNVFDSAAYNGQLVGPMLRASYGDSVSVTTTNLLDSDTSVHFHGLALRNDMDGVPGLTQDPIASGALFTQSFKAPHPGTYWYHSHSGLQLDEGLVGPLVIDDPNEKLSYDSEWVLLIDDWTMGFGSSPQENLTWLKENASGGMGGMMGSSRNLGSASGFGLGASDLAYGAFLINGMTSDEPEVRKAQSGERIRLRIINAAADTAFGVYLQGHDFRVVAADGFPVVPEAGSGLIIGMGERFDLLIDVQHGVFDVLAAPIGKPGTAARATLSTTGLGKVADRVEMPRRIIESSLLTADDSVSLDAEPTKTLDVSLEGGMMRYRWGINGATEMLANPLRVNPNDVIKMRFVNRTMMFHPMHLHGHTFQILASNGNYVRQGARKDTLIVKPHEIAEVLVVADNPGAWALHCHNAYHMETGMVTSMLYNT